MAIKISRDEIKDRLYEIESVMELEDEDRLILSKVIDNDIDAIKIILADEGEIRKISVALEEIRVNMLKEFASNDYEIFKKFYKSSMKEWTFLTDEQKKLLSSLSKLYKKAVTKYFEDRGDLMIYRKTINRFISLRLKNKESLEDLDKVRRYLALNYSYADSLTNIGIDSSIGDDGFVTLKALKINENGALFSDL